MPEISPRKLTLRVPSTASIARSLCLFPHTALSISPELSDLDKATRAHSLQTLADLILEAFDVRRETSTLNRLNLRRTYTDIAPRQNSAASRRSTQAATLSEPKSSSVTPQPTPTSKSLSLGVNRYRPTARQRIRSNSIIESISTAKGNRLI